MISNDGAFRERRRTVWSRVWGSGVAEWGQVADLEEEHSGRGHGDMSSVGGVW